MAEIELPMVRCEDCVFCMSGSRCHRYPPVSAEAGSGHLKQNDWQFPVVSPGDWCGEYREREKEAWRWVKDT